MADEQALSPQQAHSREEALSHERALSYEQARDELADVVKRLEAGGLTLEASLELWERGERLARICAEWLEGARARLAAAMALGDGDTGGEKAAGTADNRSGNSAPF
ncbi:MAG: exodeoxyribonuclease VII small subunit [Micromonosporaceae bacterium]